MEQADVTLVDLSQVLIVSPTMNLSKIYVVHVLVEKVYGELKRVFAE